MKEQTKKQLSLVAGLSSLAVAGVTILYAASPQKFNEKYDKIRKKITRKDR